MEMTVRSLSAAFIGRHKNSKWGVLELSKKKQFILYSLIIAVSVLADQITKLLAVEFLKPIPTKPIIEGVIHLTYHENRGAAFGMLADQRWIFLSVSTVMIVGLLIYLYMGKCENLLYGVSVSMIIGGGIGNMIDRVFVGYVVDFIDFRLINFAIFNGADSFVCVGAGLLVLALILDIVREAKAAK